MRKILKKGTPSAFPSKFIFSNIPALSRLTILLQPLRQLLGGWTIRYDIPLFKGYVILHQPFSGFFTGGTLGIADEFDAHGYRSFLHNGNKTPLFLPILHKTIRNCYNGFIKVWRIYSYA